MKKIAIYLLMFSLQSAFADNYDDAERIFIKHPTCEIAFGEELGGFIGGLQIDQEKVLAKLKENGFKISKPIVLPVSNLEELRNKIFLTAWIFGVTEMFSYYPNYSVTIRVADAEYPSRYLSPIFIERDFKANIFKRSAHQLEKAKNFLLSHLPICEVINIKANKQECIK